MKASFYFAMREIRRRPRHFIAQAIVSAAILTTLIMMLMQMNAEWRNDVMPERPDNYHFTLKGLTVHEKKWVRSQPWVQICYDVERRVNKDETADDTLNVRVIWSENNQAMKYARDVFDELNLWEREPYKMYYESTLSKEIATLKKSYSTKDENYLVDSNTTLLSRATNFAKNTFVQSDRVKNRSYCLSILNTYIMRPEFFILSNVLALFLGGVMMILQSESYRALMPEYGTLRSFGLKREQLFFINGIESLASSIAAIPLGAAVSLAAVQIYMSLNRDVLADDSIYLKLTENIPISVILIMSLMLAVVSLAGSMLVCYYYRKRSTMELLKKEGSVQVSFVAKTSPRFEKAKSARIYSSLQIRRTKLSFILMTAIIVIMMPLPLNLMQLAFTMLFRSDSLTPAIKAEFYYYLFQAVILFLTSVIVIYVASRSRADERHGEFAVLRSLGMNKKWIRKTAFPAVICQIALTVIPAVLLFLRVTDATVYSSTSAANRIRHIDPVEFAKIFTSDALGIILLIAPAMLLGMAFSLVRFNRRSIVESIRENE